MKIESTENYKFWILFGLVTSVFFFHSFYCYLREVTEIIVLSINLFKVLSFHDSACNFVSIS